MRIEYLQSLKQTGRQFQAASHTTLVSSAHFFFPRIIVKPKDSLWVTVAVSTCRQGSGLFRRKTAAVTTHRTLRDQPPAPPLLWHQWHRTKQRRSQCARQAQTQSLQDRTWRRTPQRAGPDNLRQGSAAIAGRHRWAPSNKAVNGSADRPKFIARWSLRSKGVMLSGRFSARCCIVTGWSMLRHPKKQTRAGASSLKPGQNMRRFSMARSGRRTAWATALQQAPYCRVTDQPLPGMSIGNRSTYTAARNCPSTAATSVDDAMDEAVAQRTGPTVAPSSSSTRAGTSGGSVVNENAIETKCTGYETMEAVTVSKRKTSPVMHMTCSVQHACATGYCVAHQHARSIHDWIPCTTDWVALLDRIYINRGKQTWRYGHTSS